MRTIRNKTPRPIRLSFSRGKVLHLGPGKTGQVPDGAIEERAVKKLIDAGEIEVFGAGGHGNQDGDAARPTHESTHGHRRTKLVMPKGNR